MEVVGKRKAASPPEIYSPVPIKKRRQTSRKKDSSQIKNTYSEDAVEIMRNVRAWIETAISKQRNGEAVFSSKNIAQVSAEICKVSESTIYRVSKHSEQYIKEKKKPGPKANEIDDFNKTAISRIILGFYKKPQPENPTLEKIYSAVQELTNFPEISQSTLFRIIKELGFVCKRRNKKMQVYQRLDVVVQRHKYLRRIEELREQGYQVFYQDETWCNSNHTCEFIWQKEEEEKSLISDSVWKGGLKVPSGAGKRLIINKIGSSDGFLKDCGECFIGKKDSADYHHEMNAQHFEDWFENKVLPALPDKSVVVIDNAKYHSRITEESKRPTTSWLKADIQEWLQKKNITFEPRDTKPILLGKRDLVPNIKEYKLEEITKEYCRVSDKHIKILRLPVGHSELNPIELIWAQIKSQVARENTTFKITDVKNLVEHATNNILSSNWKKAENHVKKVEKEFRLKDFGKDEVSNDRFIISLGDSDDESDSSDDEDEFEE